MSYGNHLCEKLLIGLFSIMALQVSVVTWWLLEPAKPPSISIEQSARGHDGKPKTEFKAGEVLYIFSHQKVVRDISRTALQSIWNEDTDSLAVRYGSLISPSPKPDGLTFPVPLPLYLEPGNYSHRVHITYSLNPLRTTETFELPNVAFRIVK